MLSRLARALQHGGRGRALFFSAGRALSSRAAVVQDVLTAHPAVAAAQTFTADGDAEAVHAVILPVAGTDDSTLISLVSELLSDGSLRRVSIKQEPELLPAAAPHGRVVLSDLLQAAHAAVDSDGDGTVTRAELQGFLEAHRLLHLAPLLAETTPETLSFAEFKNYLLDTHVLTFEPDSSVFGVHLSLVHVVSECFFDGADADGDGLITLSELEQMFAAHGIGDAKGARRAFVQYDYDDNKTIDRDEFLSLLLGEGFIKLNHDAAAQMRRAI